MSDYTEAMVSLAEMLPEQSDDPRLRAIVREVTSLHTRLAEARQQKDDLADLLDMPRERLLYHAERAEARVAELESRPAEVTRAQDALRDALADAVEEFRWAVAHGELFGPAVTAARARNVLARIGVVTKCDCSQGER